MDAVATHQLLNRTVHSVARTGEAPVGDCSPLTYASGIASSPEVTTNHVPVMMISINKASRASGFLISPTKNN